MKIKTEKTEFGKKQNGIWKKIKRISYGPSCAAGQHDFPKLNQYWQSLGCIKAGHNA
jgi:hypothetical protein